MTGRELFWGVCAVVGLVAVGYPALHVGGVDAMMGDLKSGWGGITVSLDLVFIAIPVVAFMVIEAYRLKMRWPWIWVPLILPLPGAFVIPLFFLLRERALQKSVGGNA